MFLQKKSNNEFNLFEVNFQDSVEVLIISFERDCKVIYKEVFFHFQF